MQDYHGMSRHVVGHVREATSHATIQGMQSVSALIAQHDTQLCLQAAPLKLTKLRQWSVWRGERGPRVDGQDMAPVHLQAGIEGPRFIGPKAHVEGGARGRRQTQRPPRRLAVVNASYGVVRA